METTILLKSQTNNVKLFKSSITTILVYENDIKLLKSRVAKLKDERKSIEKSYENELLLHKKLRIEINAMDRVLKKYQVAIKNELKDKFGIEKNWSFLNNMWMAIINCKIIEAKFNPKEIENLYIKKLKILEVSISAILLFVILTIQYKCMKLINTTFLYFRMRSMLRKKYIPIY